VQVQFDGFVTGEAQYNLIAFTHANDLPGTRDGSVLDCDIDCSGADSRGRKADSSQQKKYR
jgi:hypothetical protein